MNLTQHETRIVELLAEGLSIKQMQPQLGLTLSTVENYLRYVRLKLGAANTAHIVSIAYQKGILKIKP